MYIQKIFTLGSLFDGIGGWPLATVRAGICPVWASEIEAFPIEVTKARFPAMQHLGDIQKIKGADIPPVDIICAGSPCQDLSIAGNRDGLKGKRSGLFVRAMDIVKQMRKATNGKYPRYFVWENVPGAFSSNKRHDFQAVLEEVTESTIPMPKSGRWANAGMVRSANGQTAWRVLDAQFWGVPQHRERVFIIHDYRGTSAGKILFECEGLRGNIEPRRTETKGITGNVKKSVDPTIFKERAGKAFTLATSCDMALFENHSQDTRYRGPLSVSPVISATFGEGGNNQPFIVYAQKGFGDQEAFRGKFFVGNERHVRRLTPLECERLQGLPDNWTLIESKKCSDSARYKAIGNGMAQPCADFIIQGIYNILLREETKMTILDIERCIAFTSELRGTIERAPKSPERDRAIEKCNTDIEAFRLAIDVLQNDTKKGKEKPIEPAKEVAEEKPKKNTKPPKAAPADDDDDLI